MLEITLNIKGQEFRLPAQNRATSLLIRKGQNQSLKRGQIALNFFLAAACNIINATYYSASTIKGTVVRFPTLGKEEARNFLNEEGMKALDSAVYAAAMFFLSLASLYNPKWSQGHIEVRCIPQDPPNDQRELKEQFLAAMSKDPEAQILYLYLEARLGAEGKNEMTFYQDGSNFVEILEKRYKEDFENPQNYNQVLQGLK